MLMIYGATGYTARLLARLGTALVLAGRDEAALRGMGLASEVRAFGLDAPAAVWA